MKTFMMKCYNEAIETEYWKTEVEGLGVAKVDGEYSLSHLKSGVSVRFLSKLKYAKDLAKVLRASFPDFDFNKPLFLTYSFSEDEELNEKFRWVVSDYEEGQIIQNYFERKDLNNLNI